MLLAIYFLQTMHGLV